MKYWQKRSYGRYSKQRKLYDIEHKYISAKHNKQYIRKMYYYIRLWLERNI